MKFIKIEEKIINLSDVKKIEPSCGYNYFITIFYISGNSEQISVNNSEEREKLMRRVVDTLVQFNLLIYA